MKKNAISLYIHEYNYKSIYAPSAYIYMKKMFAYAPATQTRIHISH